MQDKLGFYRVGDLKFYSKIEAIEMHAKTGIHPHWDFNEAVFDCYDWTCEPTESLLELYRQRAQQLRDKYDYIILHYSGGADSQTVLESFLDNDIYIDEVVSWCSYEATKDKEHFFNAETFRVALPQINQLKEKYPWLNHRVVDFTQSIANCFLDANNKFDWFYNQNAYFNPGAVARSDLPLRIPEWQDLITSGKQVCVLWGMEKPRIYHEDGKFCVKFLDVIDNGLGVNSIAGKQPWHDELFYWTPDLPEIIIKQAHVIKNYINQNLTSSPFISSKVSNLAYKEHNGQKYWLSNHGVHKLIYPKWNINTFSVGKSPSTIFTLRDDWFSQMQNDPGRNIWMMGVEKLWKTLPDYWKNNPNDLSKGFKLCVSKNYFLEKESNV